MNPQTLFSSAHAGNPAPADGTGEPFDLAGYLISNPLETIYVRVAGDSMMEDHIYDGDILVVDCALAPKPSDVVVARVGEDFTVKKFKRQNGNLRLVPASPEYSSLEISDETKVCGVARFTIHRL